MRSESAAGGLSLRAYAGTTGVLLAFNVTEVKRDGLLGFAIEREGGNRPRQFLQGMLPFPGEPHQPGQAHPTSEAPIQRFRWSDYRVYPGIEYRYTLYAVRGTPSALELEPGPSIEITTASATEGAHRVLFNRAAAASQAFSRDFPEVEAELQAANDEDREMVMPPRALAWLSRGLLEQITAICRRAVDPSWALDIAIYEYELPAIIEAVAGAYERGAQVRIVYHSKTGDPQTVENEKSLVGWPAETRRARTTSRIFHDKFIVLSSYDGVERSAAAVLCGSTNFTHNGVYRQANVTHHIEDSQAAGRYLEMFTQLFDGADPAATKGWIDAHNRDLATDEPLTIGFSPRSGEGDLDHFATEIGSAERDVLFCTAFDLDDRIEQALLGTAHDEIVRLGLQNRQSAITGYHRDRSARFVAAAMLNDGLEGYLRESLAGQSGSIYIHTKLIVVDFTSDAPTVISGSHNLSGAASSGNDENFLILRGMTDVADCYGVEAMRLYEHYRFRWHQKEGDQEEDEGDEPPKAHTLATDSGWTDDYFESGSLECLDRERFGAPAG